MGAASVTLTAPTHPTPASARMARRNWNARIFYLLSAPPSGTPGIQRQPARGIRVQRWVVVESSDTRFPGRWRDVRTGGPSRKGFFRTLSLRVGRFRGAQRPESAFGDAFVGVPLVVACQVDVIPAQWRDVRDKTFVDHPLLP